MTLPWYCVGEFAKQFIDENNVLNIPEYCDDFKFELPPQLAVYNHLTLSEIFVEKTVDMATIAQGMDLDTFITAANY